MKLIVTILLCAALPRSRMETAFRRQRYERLGSRRAGSLTVENGMLKTEAAWACSGTPAASSATPPCESSSSTGPSDNSGVYIRFPEKPKDAWYPVHNGYEVQIDAAGDDWHCTGAIYSLSRAVKRAQKPTNEWNTMEIELRGQETIVKLNGETVNEFFGNQQVPERKKWFEPVRGRGRTPAISGCRITTTNRP